MFTPESYLSCRVKDGRPIHSSGEILRLTSLSRADTGSYQCKAQNVAGSLLSNKAELVISGKQNIFKIDADVEDTSLKQ